MKYLAGITFAIVALALPTAASAMSLSFSWGPTKKCFDSKSPPLRVSGIPKGTKKLRFHMTDLDARSYNHGGGTVTYKGRGRLGYGAFAIRALARPAAIAIRFPSKPSVPVAKFSAAPTRRDPLKNSA